MKNNKDILFISHGGGPLPLLGDDRHKEMVNTLTSITDKINKPSAILLISAHWEEEIPTVTSAASPSLIYDYHGFPKASYSISYPCPGEPHLANKVVQSLNAGGITAKADTTRGIDHGVFVPLKIMYPDADIPCVELSLSKSLEPSEHIQIGSVLSTIDHEGLLIIGSGFTFHNMKAFFEAGTDQTKAKNEQFEQWLINTCSDSDLDEAERCEQLTNWFQAPFARYCHPREEHLLPLHVCYGAAGCACKEYFELKILNKKTSMYLW